MLPTQVFEYANLNDICSACPDTIIRLCPESTSPSAIEFWYKWITVGFDRTECDNRDTVEVSMISDRSFVAPQNY